MTGDRNYWNVPYTDNGFSSSSDRRQIKREVVRSLSEGVFAASAFPTAIPTFVERLTRMASREINVSDSDRLMAREQVEGIFALD